LLILGKNYTAEFPGLEVYKMVIQEMGGLGNDRIIIVTFDRNALNEKIKQQQENLGIPPDMVLDDEVPVSYPHQQPSAQAGFFHPFGAEYTKEHGPVSPKVGAILRNLYTLASEGATTEDEKWLKVASLLDTSIADEELRRSARAVVDTIRAVTSNREHDMANVYPPIDAWLQGKEVWWTNAGSIFRGPDTNVIALVLRNKDKPLPEIPVKPSNAFTHIATAATALVRPADRPVQAPTDQRNTLQKILDPLRAHKQTAKNNQST
jgi:superfamily I DNA/RNA helicase